MIPYFQVHIGYNDIGKVQQLIELQVKKMNQDWFRSRLAELRTQNDLSARDLSLSLGQSAGYINKIENRKAMPSMDMFFVICDYLKITPKDYFDEGLEHPHLMEEAIDELRKLNPEQLRHLIALMKDVNHSNTTKGK